MSKQQASVDVLEGDKIVAEFMGGKYKAATEIPISDYEAYLMPDGYFHYVEGLEYHSSWDWLMPVIKKVFSIINPVNWDMIVEALADVDIDQCFKQVVLSIAWYNNTQTKKQ